MASKVYPFIAGNQFKTVISQFMRVFSGFQFNAGNGELKTVPVVYGNMDRVVSSILQNRDHLTNNQVPMFAVVLNTITPDTNNRRPHVHVDSVQNQANNKAITRAIGPAFNLSFDVNVIASSTTELFEILEQILLIFNPRITINVDSVVKNSDYITEIELEGITQDIQYPLGVEQRIIQIGLSFIVPYRMRMPYFEKDNLIRIITTNMFTESGDHVIEGEIRV